LSQFLLKILNNFINVQFKSVGEKQLFWFFQRRITWRQKLNVLFGQVAFLNETQHV